MKTPRYPTVLLLVLCFMVFGETAAADWPQWRGPTRDGVVADAKWPDALANNTLSRVWRVDLGEGYSGPIIAGDRVFTFETKKAKEEVVRAFDRKTGKQLWERSWPGSMRVPFFARRNGDWVKSTPATDGKHLFVIGMLDELVCLDVKDGSVVWRVDFKQRYGTRGPSFGQPCSPLLDEEAVYIQAGMSVCKIDKKTGKTLWRKLVDERQMMGGAFSSPIIATVAGKKQLLLQTRSELCGVDLKSGGVLWRKSIKAFRGMNILPPTVIGEDHVFTSSYGGGSFMFKVTKDANGKLEAAQVWRNEKAEGYMASPLIIDGHIYMHGRHQQVWCIEAKTGKVKWMVKNKKFGDYTSMVRSGSKILALGFNGTLRLINATPDKLDITAERKVTDQETWGHIAVEGEHLYIRELRGLSVFRWANQGGAN